MPIICVSKAIAPGRDIFLFSCGRTILLVGCIIIVWMYRLGASVFLDAFSDVKVGILRIRSRIGACYCGFAAVVSFWNRARGSAFVGAAQCGYGKSCKSRGSLLRGRLFASITWRFALTALRNPRRLCGRAGFAWSVLVGG